MPAYDAFLLVSFGGPESADDVLPFLENVTRGRGIPRQRLAEVAEHYYAAGGASPINQQCRDLISAVREDFGARGVKLPVYWGNRNWEPYLADTVRAMKAEGVRRAIAFVTSAYSSYSSCRQYLDDIERARAEAGPGAPRIDKLRRYFNHPGFIEPLAQNADAAIATLPPGVRNDAHLVFTAHSIPAAMAATSGPRFWPAGAQRLPETVPSRGDTPRTPDGPGPPMAPDPPQCLPGGTTLRAPQDPPQGALPGGTTLRAPQDPPQGALPGGTTLRAPQDPPRGSQGPGGMYAAELTEAARLVTERVGDGGHPWRLVYQSRSGPQAQPWLGPDVCDYLEDLARSGARAAVLVPVGFVSDHMEVRHDLDVEAAQTAARLGLPIARAATAGTHPRFVRMITELVRERLDGPVPDGPVPDDIGERAALGSLGPASDACPAGCCEYARPASGPAGRDTEART